MGWSALLCSGGSSKGATQTKKSQPMLIQTASEGTPLSSIVSR